MSIRHLSVPGKPGRYQSPLPVSCCGDCRPSRARSTHGEPGQRRSPTSRCAKMRSTRLRTSAITPRAPRCSGCCRGAEIEGCCGCSSPIRRSGTFWTTSASATRGRQMPVNCITRSLRRSILGRRYPTITATIRGRTTAAIYAHSWKPVARAARRCRPTRVCVRMCLRGWRCAPSRALITIPIPDAATPRSEPGPSASRPGSEQ